LNALSWVHPEAVHLLWPALFGVVVLVGLELRNRERLSEFLSPLMQSRLCDRVSKWRSVSRLLALGACAFFGVLAIMRPQTTGEVETLAGARLSADVMVALDVSKSMLADDAAPTRLLRAKAEVGALHDALPGYRFGLVAFAGRAALLCPLTPDAGFFRMILRGTDTTSVSKGGTRLGEAIRVALQGFGEGSTGPRLILLITDGEDHDSFPMDAAKAAEEAGISIVTVGFGSEGGSQIQLIDPKTGARSALLDRETGEPVTSKLDGELLREIALATKGAYVPAGVSALDLESIVSEHIEPLVRPEVESGVRVVPWELYPYAVLLALLCLSFSLWLGIGRSSKRGLG